MKWPRVNLHRWFRKHSLKLLAIRDTPQAIAGGVAIGIFFGFTPLFGLKTVLAIFFAWLSGSNILAAVVAGAMHDLLLPIMPAIFLGEYKIGYWLMSSPHQWPPSVHKIHWNGFSWHAWTTFVFGDVGKRLLLGGTVFATPLALLSFWVTHIFVARHRLKKQARFARKRALGPGPDTPEDAEEL
jgi:uncharacterized protein (DUF2062 family)